LPKHPKTPKPPRFITVRHKNKIYLAERIVGPMNRYGIIAEAANEARASFLADILDGLEHEHETNKDGATVHDLRRAGGA
jgi:hypothetical protein